MMNKIYLIPYQYEHLTVTTKLWCRYGLKPNRSWHGYITRYLDNKFHAFYRLGDLDNYKSSPLGIFYSLEQAKKALDYELKRIGYILLTQEQYEKFVILI